MDAQQTESLHVLPVDPADTHAAGIVDDTLRVDDQARPSVEQLCREIEVAHSKEGDTGRAGYDVNVSIDYVPLSGSAYQPDAANDEQGGAQRKEQDLGPAEWDDDGF